MCNWEKFQFRSILRHFLQSLSSRCQSSLDESWIWFRWQFPNRFLKNRCSAHLPLTDDRWKFFVPTNPTHNYENIYIWWHEIIKINLVSQALFEKTHFSVILYYKIDHFCPLKSNFHPFPAIWPNVWVWNSLLPSCYHLLVQIRHARSLSFPFWHQ